MKKLMILGGARYALPVIEAAHKLGIYVITCDYLPDNIAHKYSDEYCNISIIDKEATLDAAQKLQIDGIMSFACDPGVVTAAYVADKMGLPNVGPYESVCILQNKGKFRKFLTDNNFTVPMAKSYKNIDEALKDAGIFNWPVIVKPTDSAGSKGVTRVDSIDDLKTSIEYALSFSHSDEFIIEDFITQKGYSSDSDSFSINGELKFVSFDCQRFDKDAENPYTPAAYSWPSSISNKHQDELKSEIQRLIKLLGMKTAVYNIETRESTDGKAYIMEMSPRGGGNRLSECLRYATGVDMITNMVKYSVGLPIDEIEQKDYSGYWAEVILHSDKAGIFESLWISDELQENIVETDLWIEKNQKVGGFSAANEAIGTLIMRFESQEMLNRVLENQSKYIKVIVR
ncbi:MULTISPECIES: ATP-grasp domain-containing protein [Clostridia]|jgi:biotin carboxylase|uniref:ATP-grasp domain-containing protein n=1 Tax=Clostridia TaxID=186801 RepID=UPI0016523F1E|nr:ATP-grasp domain-containing protein [Eubacterium sp. AF22-9]